MKIKLRCDNYICREKICSGLVESGHMCRIIIEKGDHPWSDKKYFIEIGLDDNKDFLTLEFNEIEELKKQIKTTVKEVVKEVIDESAASR